MLFNTLKFIYNHPLNANNRMGGLSRFFKWQISAKFNPYPIVYPYTENSKILMWKGLPGATGNLYCGLMEYNDMGFLLHLLRPDDLFVDIGANIGVYTILASSEIGAKTMAIEPIPSTYKNLMDNIFVNRIHEKVQALNIGLGSKQGLLKFTKSFDTVNHVATTNETDTVDVEVNTLDAVLKQSPILIKIDVEGFETEVLNGARKTLENPALKAIIIELNGSGNRYGYDEKAIHEKLLSLKFKPYDYDPKTRTLTEVSNYGSVNTIYLRDLEFVLDRIISARKIKIGANAL